MTSAKLDVGPDSLTTFGSYGDLYPYIAIGIELQKLGHRVILATSVDYREKVESERLGFVPVRPDFSLEDREMLRFFFDQRRGTERVIRAVAGVIRASYEDIYKAAGDADVIVTHPIAMAAVAVAEETAPAVDLHRPGADLVSLRL
jgi:rhamnosyltransferase subunit B